MEKSPSLASESFLLQHACVSREPVQQVSAWPFPVAAAVAAAARLLQDGRGIAGAEDVREWALMLLHAHSEH